MAEKEPRVLRPQLTLEAKLKQAEERLAKAKAKAQALTAAAEKERAVLLARKRREDRKERDGQLISLGIALENQWASLSAAARAEIRQAIEKQTEHRVKKRGLDFFSRAQSAVSSSASSAGPSSADGSGKFSGGAGPAQGSPSTAS